MDDNHCNGHTEVTPGCSECQIEELRKELDKVLIQLKNIRNEGLLQYNLMRSHEVYGRRNQAFEEAAECVEGDVCRDLHDEHCTLYSDVGRCDCHMRTIAKNIRRLKVE